MQARITVNTAAEMKMKSPEKLENFRELLSDCLNIEADSENETDEELRGRLKVLKKRIKKRHLCCSASSSSDDENVVSSKKRGDSKPVQTVAATFERATTPGQESQLQLHNDAFYISDEKLHQNCWVALERLPKSELIKHAEALKSSKNYVDRENKRTAEVLSSYQPLRHTIESQKIKSTLPDPDSDSDSDVQLVFENATVKCFSEESSLEKNETKFSKKRSKQYLDTDTWSNGEKPEVKRIRLNKVTSDSGDNLQELNQLHEMRLSAEEEVDKIVLDVDKQTKEELIVVDKVLASRLKPHQVQGIKFMWDSCYESIAKIENSAGSGCIIAHCMGLGKTFQVIALAHTLLTHERTGVHTIMIVCPLSTVLNWVNEFKTWLEPMENADEIEIFEITKLKKTIERKRLLENWRNGGGVLIIGYEMFRNLITKRKRIRKETQESIMKSLIDPGADLVVCDEGHLIKNKNSGLNKAVSLVKTMRRIVLTGTPLQNNLQEYYCMIRFINPQLLGTEKEFIKNFADPIKNGQFEHSSPDEVKLMKKRSYVLHKILEGSVHRLDNNILAPFLPPKHEYVIFVRLNKVQIKIYQHYLHNISRRVGKKRGAVLADFQALQRIWTHPYTLRLNAEKIEKVKENKRLKASDSEDSLTDSIYDDSESSSEVSSHYASSNGNHTDCLDSDNEKHITVGKCGTSINPKLEQDEKTVEEVAWWSQYVEEQHFNDLQMSSKLMLLFAILKESERIDDKVLVFSQSLYSLTLIEHFLNLMNEASSIETEAELSNEHRRSWTFGVDYFRLDGTTSAENRYCWQNTFNDSENRSARLFLMSTRAGGLGMNLVGANRVIIFDASWNPSYDVQSIYRVYRFGQKKPCYVYRFLAAGTMEEKIYNCQINKLSLAYRVVDEQQIERHYSISDLAGMYQFDTYENTSENLNLPRDQMLAKIFAKYKNVIVKFHEHDSLLENKEDEALNEEEQEQTWVEYKKEQEEIRQKTYHKIKNNFESHQIAMNLNVKLNFQCLMELLRKDYPDLPLEQLNILTRRAIIEMYHEIK